MALRCTPRAALAAVPHAGLAAAVFCLALAVLRWPPVCASAPWPVHATPAAAAAVPLALLCATSPCERKRRRVWPLVGTLALALSAMAVVVATRGPAGLPAHVRTLAGEQSPREPAEIDLVGGDLADLPHNRKWWISWSGPLRVPASGTYRLWADGRGDVTVKIDGRAVFRASGERFRDGAPVFLGRGERLIDVTLVRIGPGPRLRLGWVQPDGFTETIPARRLGPPLSALRWAITDTLALLVAALLGALAVLVPWDGARRLACVLAVTRRERVLSALGLLALVALMSWPLVLDLSGSGITDRPDGRLNTWILAWDAHAIRHGLALWDAPAFHPLPDSLAFSENLLLPAIAAAPALELGGPVLGYNLVLILSLVLSGLGVHLLVRRVCDDPWAAFVAGAFFAVGAHRWIRLAHLQAQVTLFLPLTLWAIDRFWTRRTWRSALLSGLFLGLQGLSSVYVGAITAMAAVVASALAFVTLSWRDRAKLVAGLALAGVMLAPVASAYFRMRAFQGMEWTLSDVATYATTPESYLASGTRLYGGLTQRHLDPDRVQDTLFPGLVLLLAGIAGLASAPPRYRAFALVASACAIIFSLGPETAAYRFLHEHLVLIRSVRALSRFSLIPVLCLSVLGGLALAGRRRLAGIALVLFLVESSNLPIQYARYDGPPPSSRFLAGQQGAVVRLPLGENDTGAMLDAVAHWRPLVNGDSGFVPRSYTRAMELLEGDLGTEGLRFLRAVGVRHVVASAELPLPRVATFPGENVYAMTEGDRAQPVRPAPAWPTVGRRDGIAIDLGEAREIRRVVFELDERPWLTRPAVRLSVDGRTWTERQGEASLADATLTLTRDPRHGLGEITFPPTLARHVLVSSDLPARPGRLMAD